MCPELVEGRGLDELLTSQGLLE